MDGSDVASVYYVENDLSRIVRYCEKDVITLTQIYLRLTLQPPISKNEIVFIS